LALFREERDGRVDFFVFFSLLPVEIF